MANPEVDSLINATFSSAKSMARKWYTSWSRQPPACPAFGGETIHISRHGWEHLVTARRRTKFELLGRFFVLERARVLLETTTHFQAHIVRNDEKFWIFEAEVEGIRIKVIIRSIGDGSKHFYSVIRKGSLEKEI